MATIDFPKVERVTALPDARLLVQFAGGEEKLYDCRPLLDKEAFDPLRNETLFRQVKVDRGGYGVSWSDKIDLSESELWLNGMPVRSSIRDDDERGGAHDGFSLDFWDNPYDDRDWNNA